MVNNVHSYYQKLRLDSKLGIHYSTQLCLMICGGEQLGTDSRIENLTTHGSDIKFVQNGAYKARIPGRLLRSEY